MTLRQKAITILRKLPAGLHTQGLHQAHRTVNHYARTWAGSHEAAYVAQLWADPEHRTKTAGELADHLETRGRRQTPT